MEHNKALAMVVFLALVLGVGYANAAVTILPTLNTPSTNATFLGADITYTNFSVTFNMSAANVSINNNSESAINMTAFAGQTGPWYMNITGLAETNYGTQNTITVSAEIGGANESNTTYYFYVDATTPVVGNYTDRAGISNTTGGDQVLLSYAVTENNTATCGVYMWTHSTFAGTKTYVRSVPATFSSLATVTPNCNVTLTPANFTGNRYYTIQGWVTDDVSKTGVGGNRTFLATSLPASKWTAIAALYDDNKSSSQTGEAIGRGGNFMYWEANHSNIGYVAKFNTSSQGFITYQANAGTANTTDIPYGEGLYVYANTATLLLREMNVTPIGATIATLNVSMHNASADGTWKLMGNIMKDANLSVLSGSVSGTANDYAFVNYAAWLDPATGYMYNYYRNFGPTAHDKNVLKGQAFWMSINTTHASSGWNRGTFNDG